MPFSSSKRPAASRTHPQEYIARIRFNNTLPAPHGSPKLLNIANTAFSQYTSPAFASELARSMPINIEPDCELGMPLDLLPLSCALSGDLTPLCPLLPPQALDPRDRALLRTPASLGKPAHSLVTGGSSVSFLRRTEYISSEQAKSSFRSTTSRQLVALSGRARRSAVAAPAPSPQDNDPVCILAAVLRGFDVANPGVDGAVTYSAFEDSKAADAERSWRTLKHPVKHGLKPLETFPLIPHLEGMSDSGGYLLAIFQSSPTDEDRDGCRDYRVDVGLLTPAEPTDCISEEGTYFFDLYVPHSNRTAKAVKRKLADTEDLEFDDDRKFLYKYVRRYEARDPFDAGYTAFDTQPDEVAMCLQAGDKEGGPRGAYFYPIHAKYSLRPKGKTKFAHLGDLEKEEGPDAEAIKLKIRDLNHVEKWKRAGNVACYEGKGGEPRTPPRRS
ncbi:Paf1-domain-containing protein [Tricharina praecox]|uniref:Paf1-domain-containing protein n=1 Tax=Tricharina praecox TaxID=43433 RepID=UPI00221F05B0|nr:Paf1-domain-containing protein [Tricharina praecox]KAI5848041.1 Paf1-domain-containing protein [Tricharina praecox]